MIYIFYKTENEILRFRDNAIPKSLYNKHIGHRSHSAENRNVKRIPFALLRDLRCALLRYCAISAFALFYITATASFCNIAILRHCDIAILCSKSQIAMSQIHVGAFSKGNLPIYQICYAL